MKIKITVLTARNKSTNELIYAEGISSVMNTTDIFLNAKWFTQEDLDERSEGWEECEGEYSFSEAVRHLFNYEYDLVSFAVEQVEMV